MQKELVVLSIGRALQNCAVICSCLFISVTQKDSLLLLLVLNSTKDTRLFLSHLPLFPCLTHRSSRLTCSGVFPGGFFYLEKKKTQFPLAKSAIKHRQYNKLVC